MYEQSDEETLNQSTFLSVGSPVRISAWQAVVRAWLESDQDSGGNSPASWMNSAPVGSLSKTSLDSCQATEDETWGPFSGRWGNSGFGGPTECWTLSSSEFHSAAVVCSLSDILETGEHLQRYSLSPKACAGILRRAEKRGKQLPEHLEATLREVSERPT